MKIIKIVLGACHTNCYIIASDNGNCVVIDPADCAIKFVQVIESNNLIPKYIFITHGHTDHILAASDLKDEYHIPVVISKTDASRLADEALINSRPYVIEPYKKVTPDILVHENDEIWVEELHFKFYAMPGHTDGSMAIILDNCIFSGDTLLRENHGKTTLPGGNEKQLIESINALSKLEGDYHIFPGHKEETTMEHERIHNPYIEGEGGN
ncbi:MBL fold metallo-hydrolase [[Clostridium] fimetarium]|uniref:Glyoxylase, beta-lactamase superfamily II n=1 Tax=[Clostridium] fimetarium TaxID=99656 RepID=A0A1I0RB49_9FIRM|nr:MBL fold metallo-hydrolase [[Clostridium] fimetarium]SEW38023.1 Glyoxylase, beta-lactamase superfamily II [[Clostridium] fimetarium]